MIKIEPTETRFVHILNDSIGAEWRIQIPEAVLCDRGYFLEFPRIEVSWVKRNGSLAYEWETSPEYAESQRELNWHRTDEGNPLLSDVVLGLRLHVELTPRNDRLDLSLEVENTSNETFNGIYSDGGCLQHQSKEFIDDLYNRTYMKTKKGIIPLNETDRSKEIRCNYVFHVEDYENPNISRHEWFWGRSNVRPVSSFIATKDKSARFAIGIGYEHALFLKQNSDSHHCMHSGPYFGTLKPKEKRLRRGVVLFGKDIGELFEHFAGLKFDEIYR